MILARRKRYTKRYVAPKILMDVDRFSVNVGYSGGLKNEGGKVRITIDLSPRDNTLDVQDEDHYSIQVDLAEARTLRDRLTRQIESGVHYIKTGEFITK